jgi:soluble epoxide hydrolase/lipid-phosphate phosphatase
VPYSAPHKQFVEPELLVKLIPSFKYQLQLASPVAERVIDASPENLRQFLNGMYGGKGPDGEHIFTTDVGVHEEHMGKMGPAKLLTPELVDFYHQEYSRHGFHGPTNWYRTRKLNWEDETPFAEIEGGFKFKTPAMVVMGEKDIALPPKLADGMEKWFEGPLKKELAPGVGHWAMWQDPETINGHIGEFIKSVLEDKVQGKL